MTGTEAIRRIMKGRKQRQHALAKEFGVSDMAVSRYFKTGNPRESTLCELAEAVGYKLVLMPSGHRVGEDEYVIEHPKERKQ